MVQAGTKIFVGNFDPYCTADDIRPLFEKFGHVLECDLVRNFCFVHMTSPDEADIAIENLNGYNFGGRKLSVELSSSDVRTKPGMGGSDKCFYCGEGGHWSRECPNRKDDGRSHGGKATKIYVGNLNEATEESEVRKLFEAFGEVTECAKVKNYCFVHMKTPEEAEHAISNLKGTVLEGKTLTIEASLSRPGSRSECYACGRYGHVKADCPTLGGRGGGRGARGGGPGFRGGSFGGGYGASGGFGNGFGGGYGGAVRGGGPGPIRGGLRGVPRGAGRPAPYPSRGGGYGADDYYGGGGDEEEYGYENGSNGYGGGGATSYGGGAGGFRRGGVVSGFRGRGGGAGYAGGASGGYGGGGRGGYGSAGYGGYNNDEMYSRRAPY